LSDKPSNQRYTWNYFAEIIHDIIQHLGLKSVHLVLHDTAGPIGTEFAIRHPDLVNSITYGNTLMFVTGKLVSTSMIEGLQDLQSNAQAITLNRRLIQYWKLTCLIGYQAAFPMSIFSMPVVSDVFFALSVSPLTAPIGYLAFRLAGSSEISYSDYIAHSFLLNRNKGKQSFIKILAGLNNTEGHNQYLLKGVKELGNRIPMQYIEVSEDVLPPEQAKCI
jgi:pimeloyl-ACP methyl ester carboxylesterase